MRKLRLVFGITGNAENWKYFNWNHVLGTFCHTTCKKTSDSSLVTIGSARREKLYLSTDRNFVLINMQKNTKPISHFLYVVPITQFLNDFYAKHVSSMWPLYAHAFTSYKCVRTFMHSNDSKTFGLEREPIRNENCKRQHKHIMWCVMVVTVHLWELLSENCIRRTKCKHMICMSNDVNTALKANKCS